jgi:predicted amidophosphoribosyltransferase
MDDIYSNISNRVYENLLPSPPARVKLVCPSCKGVIEKDTYKFCTDCGAPVESYIKKSYEDFKQAKLNYKEESDRLADRFKHDALEHCGILGHKNADKAFIMARENRSGDGLASIVDELEELATLML